MKKVLIDHQNFCFRVVDMDKVDEELYRRNSIETNTISDMATALEIQRLSGKGYKQIQGETNE